MDRLQINDELGNKLISSSRKRICGRFVPHFHDFYEIEYIIGGSGVYTVNGDEKRCSEGMLFFMTPVDSHSVQTDGVEIFNIMFSEQLVDFHHLELFLRYSAPKAIAIDARFRPFIEHLFTEVVENESHIEYSSALMTCLLMKLAQIQSQGGSGSAHETDGSEVFSRMHSYIINNYRSRITLDTVAAYVGLSSSYVSSLFKSKMKIGFKTYLNSLRLEYARKLLLYTEQPVKQICEESGFEDVPNFIKRFKIYYGMTPTALRKQRLDPFGMQVRKRDLS